MAEKKGADSLALIFGGGEEPPPGPSSDGAVDTDITELGGGDEEGADAPPADFAVHAAEAFPELAGDDARTEALYRAIKACHPSI